MNYFKTLDRFGSNIALYSEERGAVPYEELLREADALGSAIPERSLVFILCAYTVESVSGYVGVERRGSVPVLLDATIKDVFLQQLMQSFKPRYVYLSKKQLEDFRKHVPLLASPAIVHTNGSFVLVKTDFDTDYTMHPDLALLLTTSGSTGTQKMVRQSYKNIDANTRSIAEFLKITEDDRAITTLPMSYTYGLSIIQSHLYTGASIVLTGHSVLEQGFWDLCRTHRVTTMGGVPYTYEMFKRIGFEKMDLAYLRYVTQAGGKLSKDLCTYFATVCREKHIDFVVMYGQTEATARMSYLPAEDALQKAGSIGIPIPGGSFSLRDENGTSIDAAHTPGELVYEGDNVTLGYAESSADLSKSDERRGVLHTGDIAERDDDGYYYIVGRLNRFLKILGKRVNLDEIEAWLKKEGYDCACTGDDDNLRVYLTDKSVEQKVSDILKQTFGIRPPSFSIRYVNEIPRNASNKIQYTLLP